MKFNLPVWNSVKKRPFIQKNFDLELKKSNIKGLFVRKDKNFITYEEDYTHMTPLKWKGFIESVRNNKVNFVLDNSKNLGNCLEVGAGDDFNLKLLKWTKYTICDPFLESSKNKNIEFIKGYFEKIKFKKKFNTIIMFSVLEHCTNYSLFIKKAKENLKSNGQLFIEIPIIGKQFLNGDFNCLLHEHLNYFTKTGIFNLLKKNNLSVEKFYFKNDTAFICAKNNNKKFNYEIKEKILSLRDYKNIFRKKIQNFTKFLAENKNKKIVFYGANNGLNILFLKSIQKNNFNFKNVYVVDSDKNKWNKYLGSFPKPITSPNILKHCDIVCISALSFTDEILNNLKKNKPIFRLSEI